MPVKITLRTDAAKAQTKAAIFEGVQEVFEIDIKARAVELSPVRAPKGPKNPQGIPGGTNRRSIDTEVTQISDGVSATLFTQSGYGGYLELGTVKMAARPYLNPAFEENVTKIPAAIRKRLHG